MRNQLCENCRELENICAFPNFFFLINTKSHWGKPTQQMSAGGNQVGVLLDLQAERSHILAHLGSTDDIPLGKFQISTLRPSLQEQWLFKSDCFFMAMHDNAVKPDVFQEKIKV